MNIIACPQCGRQYQVKGDPTGKSVKCANCQHVFTVARPVATTTAAVPVQAVPTSIPVGEATTHANLFPDSIPAGPDPLANHVIEDPGFAEVDVEEIRRQQIAEARKKNKLNDAYSSSSSLAKMEEEQHQKEKTRIRNVGYFSGDTLFGFDGRINRKKFWISSILFGLVSAAVTGCLLAGYGFILWLMDTDLPKAGQMLDKLTVVAPLFFIITVSAILSSWVGLALHIKRYHDLGRSGNRILLGLIPIVGGIWVWVECGFFKGMPRRNKYGPDPLAAPKRPQAAGGNTQLN